MKHSKKASGFFSSFGLKQKMRKQLFKIACSTFLFTSGIVNAQPTLEPIPAYTNHPKNFTGVSLYPIPNFDGNTSGRPYDIAVTYKHHFLSGVTIIKNVGERWFVCKKDAITGAPIALATNDIATLAGLPNTGNANPTCNGMLLDESNNRIYLFGSINKRAVMVCYSISTLSIVNTFGTNGVQVLSDVWSEVTDAVLTNYGNFAVLMNEKDEANKNFISIASLNPTGNWLGYNQIIPK